MIISDNSMTQIQIYNLKLIPFLFQSVHPTEAQSALQSVKLCTQSTGDAFAIYTRSTPYPNHWAKYLINRASPCPLSTNPSSYLLISPCCKLNFNSITFSRRDSHQTNSGSPFPGSPILCQQDRLSWLLAWRYPKLRSLLRSAV